MSDDFQPQLIEEDGDIDTNGHLALALFIGSVFVLLMVIYAFATAA